MSYIVQCWDKNSGTHALCALQELMTKEARAVGVPDERSAVGIDKALTAVQKGAFVLWLDTNCRLHLEENF